MGNFQKHISRKLLGQFPSNLVCRVACMDGIKYVNLIEIDSVVIRGVENRKLVVPVNNTLVCHMAFLAADRRPFVLIMVFYTYIFSLSCGCAIFTFGRAGYSIIINSINICMHLHAFKLCCFCNKLCDK